MKTVKSTTKFLAYVFCLSAVMYNCKTKDVDSLTPFTYTFKGLDAKLPAITATVPVSVSVTASTITSSTAAAAVSSGLANLSTTGVVPAAVKQAATDVGKVISPTDAAILLAKFTPDVIATLATSGGLSATLKAQLALFDSNPALQAYLPTFTLPTVNGKNVGGRLGDVNGINVVATIATAKATLDDDVCKAAANSAYNAALAVLKVAQTSQTATVTSTYTQLETGISAESIPCKAGIPAKYSALRAGAQQTFNTGLDNLETNKVLLGVVNYTMLKLLYLAAINDANDVFTTLQNAETTACNTVGTTKLTNAKTARDTDLNKINSNYNSAAASLTAGLTQAINSCHNQGNGG